jgi:hypothetical protein
MSEAGEVFTCREISLQLNNLEGEMLGLANQQVTA